MKLLHRILAGVGTAALAASLMIGNVPSAMLTAHAAEGQTGTIVIDVPDGYNGTFLAYKVADYAPETSTLSVVAPFDAYNEDPQITLDNIKFNNADTKDDSTFRQLVEHVRGYYQGLSADQKERLIKATGDTNPFSKSISGVPFGLYLIVQDQKGSGYLEMQPFLVILPQQTGAAATGSVATVTVEAKLEEEPTTPPSPPDNPPDDNPPGGGGDNPPSNPPSNPPTTIEEGGDNTPTIIEGGNILDEIGQIIEVGGLTGDNSQIALYGAVAGVAAIVLIVWAVRKRKKDKTN